MHVATTVGIARGRLALADIHSSSSHWAHTDGVQWLPLCTGTCTDLLLFALCPTAMLFHTAFNKKRGAFSFYHSEAARAAMDRLELPTTMPSDVPELLHAHTTVIFAVFLDVDSCLCPDYDAIYEVRSGPSHLGQG